MPELSPELSPEVRTPTRATSPLPVTRLIPGLLRTLVVLLGSCLGGTLHAAAPDPELLAPAGALVGAEAMTPGRLRDDGVVEFWEAAVLPVEGTTPPAADAPWARIALPDRWRDAGRYSRVRQGWYRLRIEGPRDASARWAIQPWRVNMNVEVWVNGTRLGADGVMTEPVTRNWNRPLLFEVPASLWRDGPDEIHLRLAVHPHFGTLAPVFVGPRAALLPDHERRLRTQILANQTLFVLTLAIAGLAIAFWLRRRSEPVYLYLAAACLSWSTLPLHLFARSVPLPADRWWPLVHQCTDLWMVLLVAVGHRLAGISRPRLELGLWTWALGAMAVYSIVDLPALISVSTRLHGITLLTVPYLVWMLGAEALRQRRSDLATFALAVAVMFGFGVHDLWLGTLADSIDWRDAVYLTPYGAPLVFVVLAWHVTGRLSTALASAERANTTLEGRVAAARTELETIWEERNRLATDQAAAGERERIYRDLHDDLGARLLSLIYALRENPARDLARDALADLREMVSIRPEAAGDLAPTLPQWRDEAEGRLASAGIAVDWRQDDAVADIELPARTLYHLTRMLRETISNVLHHAAATRVTIRVELRGGLRDEPRTLGLDVEDDGCGLPRDWAPGRGITSLRQRAAEIGAAYTLDATANGTISRIDLPLPGDPTRSA